jgi:hypothetical protein
MTQSGGDLLWIGTDLCTDEKVVIKLESVKAPYQLLRYESRVLKTLQGGTQHKVPYSLQSRPQLF